MYKLKLYEDPFYGLEEVPMVNKDKGNISLGDGMYVAGGYAMYLAGWTDYWGDIDIFVCDIESAKKYLMKQCDYVTLYDSCIVPYNDRCVQIILRLYKAPTEIVHGFDLDCCGILWDGEKLWATKRAIWAYKNNWFDPERASPSYAYRL